MTYRKIQAGRLPLAFLTAFSLAVISHTAAADTRYVDGSGGGCGGNSPCTTTVQAAVDAATIPADIRIFPGNYSESLDLGTMNGSSPGTISFQALNAGGSPAVGTVTLSSPDAGAAMGMGTTLVGTLSVYGINFVSPSAAGLLMSVQGNVNLADLVANNTGESGIDIDFIGNGASLTATRLTANNNADRGLNFEIDPEVDGNQHTFTLMDSTANNNSSTGIFIGRDEQVQTTMQVNPTLHSINANGNGGDGIRLRAANGTATLTDITANGNESDGLDLEDASIVVISDSTFQDNDTEAEGDSGIEVDAYSSLSITNVVASGHSSGKGIEIDGWTTSGGDPDEDQILGDVTISEVDVSNNGIGIRIDGNIANGDINIEITNFVGNTTAGLMIYDDADPTMVVNAIGNFWGARSGPTHPTNNPAGTGDAVADATNVIDDSVGTINFAPFSATRVSLSVPVPTVPAPLLLVLIGLLGFAVRRSR
ncbi:right-handed parallel beta-helix repeat-containing protein [Halioglobus maricola]|uniref:Right-handed parallel beta-helix repeat-containing protein n=1 Tax=Halioglobus maricola TaxID=2601894 RepID=A0A5P9NIW8_9GAMM|nr:right-handed parallel beta-helix repeat-containing protein [Halioglobus maricola]QFU74898.1 right-handed parallel beta-helix repeat-containing protein [Halioglobus maricola]